MSLMHANIRSYRRLQLCQCLVLIVDPDLSILSLLSNNTCNTHNKQMHYKWHTIHSIYPGSKDVSRVRENSQFEITYTAVDAIIASAQAHRHRLLWCLVVILSSETCTLIFR